MALIPPFFIDCVVAIGFQRGGETRSYQATGFMYGHLLKQDDDKKKTYSVFLVTNRHVFEREARAFLRFNPEGGEPAREYEIPLLDESGKQTWFAPDKVNIDVAVLGINAKRLKDEGIRFAWFRSDRHTAPRARAAELGISEGDSVFLLGFPMGLIGENRNMVVVRQGAIARIRDCLESKSKDFLIDCSVFPGNSGGPVVTKPEITAIEGTKSANSAYLLGIVANSLQYRDVAISQQTRRPRVIFEENSGLASVFPMDYVEDVIRKAMAAMQKPPPTEAGTTGGGSSSKE